MTSEGRPSQLLHDFSQVVAELVRGTYPHAVVSWNNYASCFEIYSVGALRHILTGKSMKKLAVISGHQLEDENGFPAYKIWLSATSSDIDKVLLARAEAQAANMQFSHGERVRNIYVKTSSAK